MNRAQRFWTGHIPDPAGIVRTPVTHLITKMRARRAASGRAMELEDHLTDVLDQGPSGSCTGHASSGAIFADFSAKGQALGFIPSPDYNYRNGRAIDRVDLRVALEDEGAQPNQVFRGVDTFGIKPMGPRPADGRLSDVDPKTVNDEPLLGDLEVGAEHIVLGQYQITSHGQRRFDELAAVLTAKKPVCAAIAGGSNAFQSYMGGVLPAMNAPLDHYVFLWGYEVRPNGEIVVYGRNSWGAGWGESGNFILSEAAIDELGDLVVVDMHRKVA